MRDWLSYRLSDLLLFSPRTYYRMFELYHASIWPAQLVALAIVVAIVVCIRRDDERGSIAISAMLAATWLWVAVAFHLRRYASINWGASYFAALFVVEAVLLVWIGIVRRRSLGRTTGAARRLAIALFIVAIVLPPLAGRAAGRTWTQAELFGLTPDATAIATLVLLLGSAPRAPRVLLVAPLVWCAIGGATLWALESPEAWVPIGAAALGLTMIVRQRSRTARALAAANERPRHAS